KVQVAMIEWREQRIGEVDVTIATDHDVVRGVKSLSSKAVRKHIDFSIATGASHAPRPVFTGIQASLPVHRIAIRAMRVLAVDFGLLARDVLIDSILVVVAEQQESGARPDRSLSARKSGRNLFHLQM